MKSKIHKYQMGKQISICKKTLLILASAFVVNANAQIITTIAGTGTAGYSGDGGLATAAKLNYPKGIAFDAIGNLYLAEYNNSRIRKITISTGIISTFAGNGTAGYAGDGGQATAAEINKPNWISFDGAGNLYIADTDNSLVRVVNTLGIISTFAGNGTLGFSGDGGQATAAELKYPEGLAFDALGNVYIDDYGNNNVRKVSTSGIITTFAGNGTLGFSGDGGQATAAELSGPKGITLDGSGNLYIADAGNYRIRKVTAAGIISTIAGDGTSSSNGDGGPATAAQLVTAENVVFDAIGNLYIDDFALIRKINTLGIITLVVGDYFSAYTGDGGLATAAGIQGPNGIVFDALGNMYIAEGNNNCVRLVCNAADNVSGIITAPSSNPITAGTVYVFRPKLNAAVGLLDTAGSTTIQANGAYTFTNLPYANYYIEAKADTTTYPTAVGTYYSTKANNYQWDSAIFVNHRGCANQGFSGYNITVIETPAQTGTGVISGNVTALASYGHRLADGYNNTMGAVKSIDVKLGKKPAGGCTNRTSTDAAGNYSFTSLDTGTYVVYVDIPNFTDTIVNLHVTPATSNYNNINYCADSVRVHFCGSYTQGIKQVAGNNEQVSVYPNPNNGAFNIQLNDYENTTVEVYNTIGQRIFNQALQKNLTQLSLTGFSNGMYQVRLLKGGNSVYQTKVVKQE